MKKSTKINLISLFITLAVVAAGFLLWIFWPKNTTSSVSVSADKPVEAAAKTDPYNITADKPQSNYTVKIIAVKEEINGQMVNRYEYTDAAEKTYTAGLPLILADNQAVTIKVENETNQTTNIHWHGLLVSNSQDGPALTIKAGATYTYHFRPSETGTYWYHSHYRPVAEQVGDGMLGPLVVKTAADAKYNLDQIFVLSDLKNEDTINGLTQPAAVSLKGGQIAQFRFINASTANNKTIHFPFDVRVTHVDGYALAKPYTTRSITIVPGGRTDVEWAPSDSRSENENITESSGGKIPVHYVGNAAKTAMSPFVPAKDSPVSQALLDKSPDFTLALAGGMGSGMMGGSSGMEWTINGKTYPDTGTMPVKVGQTYKVAFTNDSGMMSVTHPIHIHGAHFQVISVNGVATHDDTWYDTYSMKAGDTTDIAITFTQPGVWVLHCHILAHEDEGMMTSFTATK